MRSLVGDLILVLRWDEQSQQGLRIHFSEGSVSLELTSNGKVATLQKVALKKFFVAQSCEFSLKNQSLTLASSRRKDAQRDRSEISRGVVQLNVEDTIEGGAAAQGVELTLHTPIPAGAAAGYAVAGRATLRSLSHILEIRPRLKQLFEPPKLLSCINKVSAVRND